LWDLLQTKSKLIQSKELTTTHQQLADELGTAREVISRLLKQLEKSKKVGLGRNKITLL
ncbi:MAG: helix-turn-helix domain-containing protein, partial [Chryseotalea sp.]